MQVIINGIIATDDDIKALNRESDADNIQIKFIRITKNYINIITD